MELKKLTCSIAVLFSNTLRRPDNVRIEFFIDTSYFEIIACFLLITKNRILNFITVQ